jgi:hypothetical protein
MPKRQATTAPHARPSNLSPTESQLFTGLAADLALAGFALAPAASEGYLVSRWNLCRFCRTLQEVEQFALDVGACHGV